MLFKLLSFLGLSSVLGYSAGYDSCINVPNHGTWANGCNSTFCANSPYTIQLMTNGAVVNSYVPTTKYTIQITSPMNFRGFILNSGLGSDIATFTTVAALQQGSGTLTLGNDIHVRKMTGCTNGITHTSGTPVRQISAFWTAPPAGAGFVTFKAIIVVAQTGNNFASYRILSEASSNTSITATISATRSVSASRSITHTITPSLTHSITHSVTPSITVTPTTTVSSTTLDISTSTTTTDPVATATPTLVATSTETVTHTLVATLSAIVTPSESVVPLPSVTPTESVYPSSSVIPLPSVTPTESVYPSNSIISSASPSASNTYDGTQFLRTSNTSGVNTAGISVGVFFAAGASVAIIIASAIAFKNKKKRAVSSRIIPVSDYVTPNPIIDTSVTVSRFSLTNKTKKEFTPMQSIA